MPQPTPHRTPLKRVSQGSLFALSRSGNHPDAPHGLGFLEPAMSELADEAEALQANVEGLHSLGKALHTFNEGFGSYIYALTMHALTTEWLQAPTNASFILAKRRAEEDARAAAAALHSMTAPDTPGADRTTATTMTSDTSYATTAGPSNEGSGGKPLVGILKNAGTSGDASGTKMVKKKKPKMTTKEKKERSLAVEKIVMALPLEFRGSDPDLRRNIEGVIEALMDSGNKGLRLQEMVRPPDLNQAKVNKCLIALVNRKIVVKDSSPGHVLYVWRGV